MSEYYPDVWVVLDCQYGEEKVQRILAGWYGGFVNGDSWKLSSGIEQISEFENHYEIKNRSGSTYYCNKNEYRMSSLTAGILATLQKQASEVDCTIEINETFKIK